MSAVWQSAGRLSDAELVAAIEQLVAELPAGDAVGLFELGGALDATDLTEPAGGDHP
jgi:hypothetical protein